MQVRGSTKVRMVLSASLRCTEGMMAEVSSKVPSPASPEAEAEVRARMELLQAKLNATKIAYLNRMEIDGNVPTYEDLTAAAKAFIAANYELQKILYGSVKLKISVSKLLRGSNR
jgi:hypothetical protein